MLLIVILGVGMRVIARVDMINGWRILRIIRFRCFSVSMGVILCSRGCLLRLGLYVSPLQSLRPLFYIRFLYRFPFLFFLVSLFRNLFPLLRYPFSFIFAVPFNCAPLIQIPPK